MSLMICERLGIDAVRAGVVLALALVAAATMRRPAAAARRLVLATALVGVLVMPLVSALAPSVEVPVAALSFEAHEKDTLVDGFPGAAPEAARPAAPATSDAFMPWKRARPVDVVSLVAVVWALGALLVLARLGVGMATARRLVRRATPADDWERAVAAAERLVGVRAVVRISADVAAPAVTGVFAPVVLVPPSGASWSDARRLAVLLHEVAHIRQRDCLVQLLATLACAMHWFNPLVWLAARRLRLERELAADDAVLAAGTKATGYAEDLVAIAVAAADDIPATALGMGARSHLSARVTAIVAARARRHLRGAHATALVAGSAAVVLGVACANSAKHDPGANSPSAAAPTAAAPTAAAPTAAAPTAAPATTAARAGIRPDLQAIASDEYARLLADSGAKRATVLVLDAATGAVVADVGASRTPIITGSTLKPLVLATALEDGVVTPDDRFDLEQGSFTYDGKTMHDAGKYGVMTVGQMLAVSSNVGFTKLFDRLGAARLDKGLRSFGITPPPMTDHAYQSAVVAIGELATATPLDLAHAYVTLANGGQYSTMRSMLEGVVYGEPSTGKLAAVDGVRVAGKTGTASWNLPGGGEAIYASFVGFVPSTAPRFVILVGAEQPKDKEASGGTTAAPVFARIATRALAAR